jgi:protein-tyrosine phosphatase
MLGAEATSAGVRAVAGRPIVGDAARALAELGGDPEEFASRRITPAIIAEADLILTMTEDHRDKVLMVSPAALRRTFTLSEAARLIQDHHAKTVAELTAARPFSTAKPGEDIADPMGRQYPEFHSAATRILELTRVVLDQLLP